MSESKHSHPSDSIQISLNGKSISTEMRTLVDILTTSNISPEQPGIAVALNDAVVRRSEWNTTQISNGDRIEVITAMQGG